MGNIYLKAFCNEIFFEQYTQPDIMSSLHRNSTLATSID
jgi:hypothetical protein